MSLRFEDLQVYQKSLTVVDELYKVTKSFPSTELFLLTNQLRRAAISITLNIAEGSGRTKLEFQHFLNIARTSCYECVAALQIAERQGYLPKPSYQKLEGMITEVVRMLNGLKQGIKPKN